VFLMPPLGNRPQRTRFGLFELDVAGRLLRERGNPVKLQPQQFDILVLLIEHAGRVVSREEIRKHIWDSDTFVDFERSINFAINQIRAALRDDPENPRFIETAPRRGYRFIATIESDDRAPHGLPSEPISIDREPIESGHPKSMSVPTKLDEPEALIQPVSASAPSRAASPVRNILRTLILGGSVVVVAALAVAWWLRNRPAAPAGIKLQQLTHNSGDNPVTSVTVSPDGKYFAYSDLGGLHVKLLKTGEVRDFSQPAELGKARVQWLVSWLPDSTGFLAAAWILGTPSSTWQASVMGGSLRLLRKDAVAWSVSPDGSQFVFTDANESEMEVMDIGGSRPRKVAEAGAKSWFSYIQWSPDGSHLLYIKRVPTAEHVQNFMELQDLKSGFTTTLLSGDTLHSLFWLHDGRILYVESEPNPNGKTCRNWITRLDSKSSGFSTKPRLLTQVDGSCVSYASATADGKQLYFLKQTTEPSVYVADLTPDATRISPPRHLTLTEDREFPAGWTADSREIVFLSNREGKWGFYRQSLDSVNAKPILTGIATRGLRDVFPRVSADGAWLVYAPFHPDYVPGTPMDILRVPISGGSPELVLKAAVSDWPRCARAPATLCAVAATNKDQMIITGFDVMRGAGPELARMKIDPDKDYTWDLSPDGTRIATLKRGTSEIHVLSWRTHADQKFIVKGWDGLAMLDWTSDGKGLFTCSMSSGTVLLHTDLQGNASVLWEPKGAQAIWAVSSPDGRHVAMPGFASNSNIWSMQDF